MKRFIIILILAFCAGGLFAVFQQPAGEQTPPEETETALPGTETATPPPEVLELHETAGGTFYYDQLTAEEQTAYGDILRGLREFDKEYVIRIPSKEMVGHVFDAVIRDHPEIFWADGYTVTENSWAGIVVSEVLSPNYSMDRETAETQKKAVDASVEEILSPLTADLSDYAKVQYLYKYIINNTDYSENAPYSQNICSVLLYHESVCMGYARAFQYLTACLGMTSTTVTGIAGEQNHAWNLVQMDGEWYNVDTTWGDPNFQSTDTVTSNLNYAFLGMTTEDLSMTHTPDSSFSYPDCTAVKDSYYVQEGLYYDRYDRETVGERIREHEENGQPFIAFAFSNWDAYEKAVEDLFTDRHVFDYFNGSSKLNYRNEDAYRCVTIYF